MSFDANHPNRKDHRAPFYGSARFDPSCRHGGSCPRCIGNRTFNTRKRAAKADPREDS